MPSFQVDGNCYSDTAAVQAMAAREVGRVVVLGAQTYVIDVDAVSTTTITYRLTDLASASSISKVVNVTPQPCGLLDTADGLVIGWAIAAAWLATAAVLFIRRGYRHDTGFHGRHGLHFGHIVANLKQLTLALAVVSSPSFAFYVTPSTPPGWVNAAATGATYRASPSDISFANGIRQKIGGAAVNVGGKTLTLATAYKYTADASKVAARFAYANPLLFVGILAGTAAAAYYLSPTSDLVVDDGQWKVKQKDMQCLAFVGDQPAHSTVYGYAGWSESFSCYPVNGGMMWGWTVKGPDGQTWKEGVQPTKLSPAEKPPIPITETDYVNRFMNDPVPPGVPQVLPVPLPVGQPIVNPSPGAIPVPQPLRVPQGEPQAIPGTDPKQWRSPAVDIVPSPTITDPWRVDVQPKDVISTDPAPLPETAPVPETPDPNTSTTPTPEQIDLCEKNPDILACAKPELDTPDEDQTPSKNKDISISPAGGFGSGGGSCPSGKTLKAAGIQLSYQPVCDFMSAMRPVVIALAWLGAGLILLGLRGQTS